MIEAHTSTVYTGDMEDSDRVALIREGVGMMVEYGGATIISEDTDGEQYYRAYVSVGGGIVFYFYITNDTRYLTISKGRIVNGVYQAEFSFNNTYWSYRPTSSQYIQMRIGNGGAVWDFHLHIYGSNGNVERWIRVSHLLSSIDNSEHISGYLYSSYSNFPNSSYDQVLINGAFLGLSFVSVNFAQSNVDPNDIVLFPSLMYLNHPDNGMGVPLIGGETPYFMGIPGGVTLDPFTEFQVNGGRYISLGNLAIRSR